MEKLLTSLFLQAVFKDTKTTKALMGMIFEEPATPKVVKKKVINKCARSFFIVQRYKKPPHFCEGFLIF